MKSKKKRNYCYQLTSYRSRGSQCFDRQHLYYSTCTFSLTALPSFLRNYRLFQERKRKAVTIQEQCLLMQLLAIFLFFFILSIRDWAGVHSTVLYKKGCNGFIISPIRLQKGKATHLRQVSLLVGKQNCQRMHQTEQFLKQKTNSQSP